MKHSVLHVLATVLLLCSGSAIADQSSMGMFPNVSEQKISFAAYQSAYENLGASKDVPKLVVFSPTGECVGITTGKSTAAAAVVGFITDSLRKHQKKCEATISNQFGLSQPGPDSGTGKPEVYLIVFDVPFCKACNDFKTTLLRASHSELVDMRLSIMSVVLSKQR